jgi:FixJ family two-component response regulator
VPYLNPTVFVVGPDPAVGQSMTTMFRRSGWGVESFETAAAFLAHPARMTPSCLVVELTLPDLDGFELLRRIAVDRKETPAIVLSGLVDIPLTVRAIKAGAVEVLIKPLAEDVLLGAVRNALVRSHIVLQQEAELLELRQRHDSLSCREREVMARVVSGLLNKQVGATLGISEITVKAHRGKVMRKMGAYSLAELVSMALQLGLSCDRSERTRLTPFLNPVGETMAVRSA